MAKNEFIDDHRRETQATPEVVSQEAVLRMLVGIYRDNAMDQGKTLVSNVRDMFCNRGEAAAACFNVSSAFKNDDRLDVYNNVG